MTTTKSTYIVRGNNRHQLVNTQVFNIDNGSGATIDDQTLYAVNDLFITDAYIVYDEATDTTGAAGATVKIGTTAGGAQIVAATNLETSKAVGAATQLTLVSNFVPAGTTVHVRHTGVAVTEAGKYHVQIRYFYK